MSELFYSLVVRNIRKSVLRKDILANRFLNLAIVSGVIVTFTMIYTPLADILNIYKTPLKELIYLILISSSILYLHQIILFVFHMKRRFDIKRNNYAV